MHTETEISGRVRTERYIKAPIASRYGTPIIAIRSSFEITRFFIISLGGSIGVVTFFHSVMLKRSRIFSMYLVCESFTLPFFAIEFDPKKVYCHSKIFYLL